MRVEGKDLLQLPLCFPSSFPNVQCPMPHALCPALIIGKKRGKLPTASIIEFDLLFNAHANNQL